MAILAHNEPRRPKSKRRLVRLTVCGWFGRGDGLTPETFNREDPADPRSSVARSNRDASYVGDFSIDAGHSLLDVNEQLFGGPVPTPPVATNTGFVANYAKRAGNTPASAHQRYIPRR